MFEALELAPNAVPVLGNRKMPIESSHLRILFEALFKVTKIPSGSRITALGFQADETDAAFSANNCTTRRDFLQEKHA